MKCSYLESIEAAQMPRAASSVQQRVSRRADGPVALFTLEQLVAVGRVVRLQRQIVHVLLARNVGRVRVLQETVHRDELVAHHEAPRTERRAGGELLFHAEAGRPGQVALAVLPPARLDADARVGVHQHPRADARLNRLSALFVNYLLAVGEGQAVLLVGAVEPVGHERDPDALVLATGELVRARRVGRQRRVGAPNHALTLASSAVRSGACDRNSAVGLVLFHLLDRREADPVS